MRRPARMLGMRDVACLTKDTSSFLQQLSANNFQRMEGDTLGGGGKSLFECTWV